MADVAEQIFEAVQVLIDKQIKSVKFDETIRATVTDVTNANTGEYLVTTGNATFKAYSTETRYRENEAVLVTIPQGNYDNQKMIIGKQVDDMNTPMVYTSPFETIIDVTGNLVSNNKSWSYWANDPDNYVWPEGTNNLIIHRSGQADDSIKVENIFCKGYSMVGIQAQFSTWLSEYDVCRGDYGLLAELTFKDDASGDTFKHYFALDSSEFFGDIYNFETYYTQEQVFDIKEYLDYPIVGVKITPYQKDNFITITGARIDGPSDDTFSTVQPNIFVKDIYLCLGTLASDFKTDTAEVMTDSTTTYYKETGEGNNKINEKTTQVASKNITVSSSIFVSSDNTDEKRAIKVINWFKANTLYLDESYTVTATKRNNNNTQWRVTYRYFVRPTQNYKNIMLRWIHKDSSTGIIKPVDEKNFPGGYKVYWYRYKLGAPSPDGFAGAHWERFYGCQATVDEETGDWTIPQSVYSNWTDEQKEVNDLATDNLLIHFQPNVNLQSEKLKAIVLKEEQGSQGNTIFRLIAVSNVLELINNTDVRSQATLIDANALSIRFEDDEKGHYFLYDEGGDVGVNEDLEVRKLVAVFDEEEHDVYAKSPLNIAECSSIKWTFPVAGGNTMIVPMDSADETAQPLAGNVITDKGEVGFTIKSHLNHNATDNTILLEIVKDGQNYQAQVQPIFGTAGTNGSDYTVVLSWRDGKNAVNLSASATDHTLIGDVAIYDQAGNVQPWPSESKIKCEWEVASYSKSLPTIIEKEEAGLFYPVLDSAANSIYYGTNDNGIEYFYIKNSNYDSELDGPYYEFKENNETHKYEFVVAGNNPTSQLYRKSMFDENSQRDTRKYKLEFKQVDVVRPEVNEDTGVYKSVDQLDPPELARVTSNGKIVYRYSQTQRYFVQFDNVYILDPWQTYQEAETYYRPVLAEPTIYEEGNAGLRCEPTQSQNNKLPYITISPHGDFTSANGLRKLLNSVYVLKLIVTDFGDYDLTTYYPIPMKNGETKNGDQQTFIVDYIEGPDRVRYGSSGETDYNKNPYKIVTRQWTGTGANAHFVTKRHGYKEDAQQDILQGFWQLVVGGVDSLENTTDDNFFPGLVDTVKSEHPIVNRYDIPILYPVGTYIPTAPPYAVQFVRENNNVQTILWSQPILVYQNKYPSRTLNKWNGKDILTDENTGTITASGFAAGKKESDNSFTGVVIGDWSRDKIDACVVKNTGLYGFNHGAMSYAFKDDGTGFIGKDGRGRIHFNGNNAQIYSSNWKGNENLGMFLDVDDGVIRLHSKIMNSELLDDYTITNSNIIKTFFNILNYLYIATYDMVQPDPTKPGIRKYRVTLDTEGLQAAGAADDVTKLHEYREDLGATTHYAIIKKEVEYPKNFKQHQQKYYYKLEDDPNNYDYIEIDRTTWETEITNGTPPFKDVYSITDLTTIKDTYTFPWGGKIYFNRIFIWQNGSWSLVDKDNQSGLYVYNSTAKYCFNETNVIASQNNVNEMRYITLSSAESLYPLSIGSVFPSSKRSFRVRWDGKTYITDGDFSGRIDAKSGRISGDLDVTGTLNVTGTLKGGTIEGAKISGANIYGSEVRADYLEAGLGKIGGWTINENKLFGGKTTLHSTTGITTNVLTLDDTVGSSGGARVFGRFGVLQGQTSFQDPETEQLVTQDTATLGIQVVGGVGGPDTNHSSIVLETGGGKEEGDSSGAWNNIRLSAVGGDLCNGIYIRGNKIELGTSSERQNEQGQNVKVGPPLVVRYDSVTGKWWLEVNTDKECQTGIYARFA